MKCQVIQTDSFAEEPRNEANFECKTAWFDTVIKCFIMEKEDGKQIIIPLRAIRSIVVDKPPGRKNKII